MLIPETSGVALSRPVHRDGAFQWDRDLELFLRRFQTLAEYFVWRGVTDSSETV